MSYEVTIDYLKDALKDIVDDPEVRVQDKLKAIKMLGEHLKMFGNKHSSTDLRVLFARMDSDLLKGMVNGSDQKSLPTSPIEMETDPDGVLCVVNSEHPTGKRGVSDS